MNRLHWTQKDLETERQQLLEEGRDSKAVKYLFEDCVEDGYYNLSTQCDINELFDDCRAISMCPDYLYIEPSDLEGIRKCRTTKNYGKALTPSNEVMRDKIKGAWQGRVAGCLLGKPLEGIRRPRLQKFLSDTGGAEIDDYIWRRPNFTEETCKDMGWDGAWKYWNTNCFPGDDDTDYTVMNMAMVKQHGINFTPDNVADFWMWNIPILKTCTAEQIAYRNFVNNIMPPESASFRNPYREWIGAQIRADFYGYINPGDPEKAAAMAWRDASISHVKNGIYGSMWVAAMLAVAAVETDPRTIILAGLAQIPEKSRLHEGVSDILWGCQNGASYQDIVCYIHAKWDENTNHGWCHVISNSMIITAALLYSEGNYEKAICNAVSACFDTDCVGATVGSIMGMILGTKGVPEKWTGIMKDRIKTAISGYADVSISGLADEMFDIWKANK
jgi:ADP-ribosylglycohydrolase